MEDVRLGAGGVSNAIEGAQLVPVEALGIADGGPIGHAGGGLEEAAAVEPRVAEAGLAPFLLDPIAVARRWRGVHRRPDLGGYTITFG